MQLLIGNKFEMIYKKEITYEIEKNFSLNNNIILFLILG
jgi:hypothetical protein